MPYKLTEWRNEPMSPGTEFLVREREFANVENIATYIQEYHDPHYRVQGLYQLRTYASLSGAKEMSVLFGHGVRLQIEHIRGNTP